MSTAYGAFLSRPIPARTPKPSAALLAHDQLADEELFARELLYLVHVTENAAQLRQESGATFFEISSGLEQVLVRDHLTRGGEQQRRYGLVAANPVLRDVLSADAESQLGQLLLVDVRWCVPEHVGDDLVRLDEGAQHGARDQRPLRPQH